MRHVIGVESVELMGVRSITTEKSPTNGMEEKSDNLMLMETNPVRMKP